MRPHDKRTNVWTKGLHWTHRDQTRSRSAKRLARERRAQRRLLDQNSINPRLANRY